METLQTTNRIEPIRFDIAAPATVTGGSTNAVPDGIDPNQRRVNFNIVSSGDLPEGSLRREWANRPVWIVIHGWDNFLVDPYNDMVMETMKFQAATAKIGCLAAMAMMLSQVKVETTP
jgi:hypothetical protein